MGVCQIGNPPPKKKKSIMIIITITIMMIIIMTIVITYIYIYMAVGQNPAPLVNMVHGCSSAKKWRHRLRPLAICDCPVGFPEAKLIGYPKEAMTALDLVCRNSSRSPCAPSPDHEDVEHDQPARLSQPLLTCCTVRGSLKSRPKTSRRVRTCASFLRWFSFGISCKTTKK